MKQLTDRFNRRLNYLRVSITDRCNLRCRYCAPVEPFTQLSHTDILQYEEIIRIIKAGIKLGINKVRVTGGEPLVRKGACTFLKMLNNLEGLEDVTLTTNGVLLKDYLDDLADAGVKRVNVSLDSIDKSNYAKITGRDYFQNVWEGIEKAIEKGFHPVKINVVAMKGINDHEFIDFAQLSKDLPIHVRFIEHMPIGDTISAADLRILTPEIKSIVSEIGELIPINSQVNDGPAFRYRFKNAKGEIGFISPISRHFCFQCNRLRLTANGMLRSCLLSSQQVDIKTPLRQGISDQDIEKVFQEAIDRKGQSHRLNQDENCNLTEPMSAIGG